MSKGLWGGQLIMSGCKEKYRNKQRRIGMGLLIVPRSNVHKALDVPLLGFVFHMTGLWQWRSGGGLQGLATLVAPRQGGLVSPHLYFSFVKEGGNPRGSLQTRGFILVLRKAKGVSQGCAYQRKKIITSMRHPSIIFNMFFKRHYFKVHDYPCMRSIEIGK